MFETIDVSKLSDRDLVRQFGQSCSYGFLSSNKAQKRLLKKELIRRLASKKSAKRSAKKSATKRAKKKK